MPKQLRLKRLLQQSIFRLKTSSGISGGQLRDNSLKAEMMTASRQRNFRFRTELSKHLHATCVITTPLSRPCQSDSRLCLRVFYASFDFSFQRDACLYAHDPHPKSFCMSALAIVRSSFWSALVGDSVASTCKNAVAVTRHVWCKSDLNPTSCQTLVFYM